MRRRDRRRRASRSRARRDSRCRPYARSLSPLRPRAPSYLLYHVDGRAEHGPGHALHLLAKAEVGHLHHPVVEQHVARLQVPMQNAHLDRRLKSADYLGHVAARRLLLDAALLLYLLLQSAPVAELVHQVDVAVRLQQLHELHHVPAADRLQHLDLVASKSPQLRRLIVHLKADLLNRERLFTLRMHALVHLTEFAASNLRR